MREPGQRRADEIRCLLVGVRGHGGEEVYSRLLRDAPPPGVRVSATFDFHRSTEWGQCLPAAEVLLNRLVNPCLPFNMGFRVLRVDSQVDVVHVHTYPTVLLHRQDRPVVFSAGSSHYAYVREYEGWDEARIRRQYALARVVYGSLGVLDGLITHDRITIVYTFSEHARKVYLDFGVPADKIRVLYPGFDIPEPKRLSDGGQVTYLFLGREPRRKGGDAVLRAFQALREVLPRARLLYVSDEPPTPMPPGVEARTLVPPEDVASVYGEADVFVNPTRAEGFGFTNVEAQGFGLPVVSTRLGAIPEVVEDGRTGFLVGRDDDAALLAAMRRLGESRALREEMGGAARERFVARFSLGLFRRNLGALYEEAMAMAGLRSGGRV